MKTSNTQRLRRWGLVLVATLSGGTTFASCDTRIRQDLVDGTKTFLFSLFDPNLFLGSMTSGTTTGTNSNATTP